MPTPPYLHQTMNNNKAAPQLNAGIGVKSHKELFSKNESYDPLLNEKLCLLYKGGFDIQKHADLFLERLVGLENSKAYEARLKCIAYIPYLSEFVTQFSSSLFSEELEIKPPSDADDTLTMGDDMEDDYYKRFIQCCDLQSRSVHQFMHDIFECALHQIQVYVGIDFPKQDPDNQPTNKAQEKQMGLSNGYLYTIPYDAVIDWKKDAQDGKFIWLKIFEECFPDDDPLVEGQHYYQFKIWTVKNGKGSWQIWKSALMRLNKKFSMNTKYTLDEEGSTSFPQIPIFEFRVPKGYHVGQQIGALCQEHYQRRSFMVSNANKTCVALGVVKLGPEVGAPGDAVPPDIEMMETSTAIRSKLESDGWTVLRKTDKWEDDVEIVEAKGESHKFIAEELKHLVESMMQTLRQMNMTATANMKAVGRSAASKQVDQHGTSMILSVYDRLVKDFVRKLFMVLALGRNEYIEWSVDGLSIAQPVEHRSDIIDEVTKIGLDIFKLPDMFKNKYIYRIANELLESNLSDREKLELQEKIEEAVAEGKFEALDEKESEAAGNKMAAVTAQSDVGDNEPMAMGPSGQPLMPEGAHLQTGEHVDGKVVFNQLSKDYQEKDIEFVKHIPWTGPVEVPLSSIDFSNKDNWQASQPEDQDHVDMFADKMANDNYSKPIILVNNPSNDNKMMVVDGHHRALGALKNGQPVNAFVGQVGSDHGPWDKLHSKQVGSMQQSMQKEVSQQVSASERAVGGKTK